MKFLSPALVTGASGFVGSHLAEALAKNKVKVRLLLRPTSKLPFTPGPNMEIVQGDVTDLESVRKAVKGVKIVYHVAGLLRGSNVSQFEKVNTQGTRNVCLAMSNEKGVKRLVYISSLSAAGPSKPGMPLTEKDDCHPVSYYGETKMQGERVALSYAEDFEVSVIRPGAVYGPRETDVLSYFKMVKMGVVFVPGDGKQEISFIHVTDLVDAILKAGQSPKAKGQVYFASVGKGYRWEEFSKAVGKAMGKSFITVKVPMGVVDLIASFSDWLTRFTQKPTIINKDKIKEGKAEGWVCSSDKLQKQLGFKPQFDLEKGVQNSVDFYRSAGLL